MCPRSLAISRFFIPEMRERKCLSHEQRCRQTGGTLCGYLLAFPYLSFRCFRFTLSQPLPELPLTFFAFVVGENVGQDTSGDVLDFVLRNTGMLHELLLAAQVGCSLRFDMKFLRCSCGWADDLLLMAWLLSQETENAGACQAYGLMGVCILLSCIISHWERVSIA